MTTRAAAHAASAPLSLLSRAALLAADSAVAAAAAVLTLDLCLLLALPCGLLGCSLELVRGSLPCDVYALLAVNCEFVSGSVRWPLRLTIVLL